MAFHGVHPGLILKEELEARGLSATAFGLKLRVAPQRIQEIVGGRRVCHLGPSHIAIRFLPRS
jgi:plasmid maintenance system antidote protein VapI